jgi:hypothetical protein
MNDQRISASHKINFDTPGVYIVSLKSGEFSCEFPVQIIDETYLKSQISVEPKGQMS